MKTPLLHHKKLRTCALMVTLSLIPFGPISIQPALGWEWDSSYYEERFIDPSPETIKAEEEKIARRKARARMVINCSGGFQRSLLKLWYHIKWGEEAKIGVCPAS